MTGTFDIPRRTYLRRSTAGYFAEQNSNPSNVKISLPRLSFLEKDGPYVPDWAVEYVEPPPKPVAPVEIKPENALRKKKKAKGSGPKGLTPFEIRVEELRASGMTVPQICSELQTTASTVVGALNRYIQKNLK